MMGETWHARKNKIIIFIVIIACEHDLLMDLGLWLGQLHNKSE